MKEILLLVIILLIVVLVLTILNYTKSTDSNGSSGSSGNLDDYLPLAGGTMTGNINMGNQTITSASLVSTTGLTLNNQAILYGLPSSSGEPSLNLYVDETAVAPYLYKIPDSGIGTGLISAYNGENWVFSSNFSVTNTYNIVTNYTTLPAGFYLNLTNRKAVTTPTPTGNITIRIYNVTSEITPGPFTPPFTPPAAVPVSLTLNASTSRYLYFDGTAFSLV